MQHRVPEWHVSGEMSYRTYTRASTSPNDSRLGQLLGIEIRTARRGDVACLVRGVDELVVLLAVRRARKVVVELMVELSRVEWVLVGVVAVTGELAVRRSERRWEASTCMRRGC